MSRGKNDTRSHLIFGFSSSHFIHPSFFLLQSIISVISFFYLVFLPLVNRLLSRHQRRVCKTVLAMTQIMAILRLLSTSSSLCCILRQATSVVSKILLLKNGKRERQIKGELQLLKKKKEWESEVCMPS